MLYQLSYVRERASLYPVPAGTFARVRPERMRGSDLSALRVVASRFTRASRGGDVVDDAGDVPQARDEGAVQRP